MSLIAVFIPLLFMTGVVGRLFKEFSVTLSVVGGGLRRGVADPDADDVRPAAAPGARRNTRPGRALAASAAFDALLAGYRRTLDWTFRHQTLVLLVGAATLVGTIWLYIIVPKGFLPRQDTGVMRGGDRGRAERLDPAAGRVADRDGARSSGRIRR